MTAPDSAESAPANKANGGCIHCDIGRHRYLGPIHSDPFHIVHEDVFPCTKQEK